MRNTHLLPRDELSFTRVEGRAVPSQPWPQKFVITRTLVMRDAVEVRPLTFTGIVKGVAQNFVTMTWWRLLYTLRLLGFLSTPEACVLRLRDLTWRFWRYQEVRHFRCIRRIRRYAEQAFR